MKVYFTLIIKGKRDKPVYNHPHQLGRRRQLRRQLTPAEARLWTYLRSGQLDGRKFRRQQGIGSYILDFYCPSEQLAIELDGESHNNPTTEAKDAERTKFLNALGIRVLRFENCLVFDFPENLLHSIREHFRD